MLNKHNLNVAKAASPEESRFTLNAIRVTPKETIATDGHILVRCTTPKGVNAVDFPEVPGQPAATDEFVPFNLPAKAALEAVKALPKKNTYPIIQNAAVSVNGHAQVMVTDLENPRTFRAVEGSFPDYERVIPDLAKSTFSISLDAALLRTICEQVIGFKGKDQAIVKLWFEKNDRAVYFRSAGGDEQVLDGCIMPCREQ